MVPPWVVRLDVPLHILGRSDVRSIGFMKADMERLRRMSSSFDV